MEEPSEGEVVSAAVNALLLAVGRSADDLRAFHDVLSRAHLDGAVPFPRLAVATTESIVDHLKQVEEKLQEVIVALGLSRAH